MKLSVWKNCKNTSKYKKQKKIENKQKMKNQQKDNKKLQFFVFFYIFLDVDKAVSKLNL